MRQTAKRAAYLTAGLIASALGFVGLVLPFMPGFLFFAVAAVCFLGASESLRRRMRSNRRFRPYFERYEGAHEGLTEFERMKLAGWLSFSAVTSYFSRSE